MDCWREADQLKEPWYKGELIDVRLRAAADAIWNYGGADKGVMNVDVWEWLAKAGWVVDRGMEDIWNLWAWCLSRSETRLKNIWKFGRIEECRIEPRGSRGLSPVD